MNLGNKFSFDNSQSVNSSVGKRNTLKGQGKQQQTSPISIPTPLYAFLYTGRMTLYHSILVTEFLTNMYQKLSSDFLNFPVYQGHVYLPQSPSALTFFQTVLPSFFLNCMHSLWESEAYKTKYPKSFMIEAFFKFMYHNLSQ